MARHSCSIRIGFIALPFLSLGPVDTWTSSHHEKYVVLLLWMRQTPGCCAGCRKVRPGLCSQGACNVVEGDKGHRKLASNTRWHSTTVDRRYKQGWKCPDPFSLGGISQVENSQGHSFGQEE